VVIFIDGWEETGYQFEEYWISNIQIIL